MQQAKTQYTRSGDIHIAYQAFGEGPIDLIYVQGWVSHVEMAWEVPNIARFLRRLASFSRLIAFDKHGTGLSDRVPNEQLPTLEERMDDLRAVMDAVGSERAALCGNPRVVISAPYSQQPTPSERRRSSCTELSLNESGVQITPGADDEGTRAGVRAGRKRVGEPDGPLKLCIEQDQRRSIRSANCEILPLVCKPGCGRCTIADEQ